MTLRITWWGDQPGRWHAIALLDRGRIESVQPLALEPDAAASVWLEPLGSVADLPPEMSATLSASSTSLKVEPIFLRRVDGVELTIQAPKDAKLFVGLRPHESVERAWLTLALSELADHPKELEVPQYGLRLLAKRRADDELKIHVHKPSLVFRPQETFSFRIEPQLEHKSGQEPLRLQLRLVHLPSGKEQWRQDAEMAPATQSLPFAVRLPNEEGVYELIVTVEPTPRVPLPTLRGLPTLPTLPPLQSLPEPPWTKAPLATRRVQLIVLADVESEPASSGTTWRQIGQLEPGATRWRERLAGLPQPHRLLPFTRPTVVSRGAQTVRQGDATWTQLEPASPQGEANYYLVTLPIDKTGIPHLLEVEIPDNHPQILALYILELTAAGSYWPVATSAILVPEDPVQASTSAQASRHQVIFWPRTKEPLLLFANLSFSRPARWGKIALMSTLGRLMPSEIDVGRPTGRIVAAYSARPWSPEMFGASVRTSEDWAARDWLSFYEGAIHFVDYLRFQGYNAVCFPVYAEGGGLYPSQVLQPNCRYDTGPLAEAGTDPVRKDVVELFARLCDRTGLAFIPALELAAPLPQLEWLLRHEHPESEGLLLVGEPSVPRGISGPHPRYNPLHPQVQAVIERAVDELLDRYADHVSFCGIAIQLTPETFTHFPGLSWPLDGSTLRQFQEATGIKLGGTGATATPPAVLLTTQFRQEWLTWRAKQLTQFYGRLAAKIASRKSTASLFLVGPEVFDTPELRHHLRPRLPQQLTLADAYLLVGLDVNILAQQTAVVLLRPQCYVLPSGDGVDFPLPGLAHLPDYDRLLAAFPRRGALLFRRPVTAQLGSFQHVLQSPLPQAAILEWSMAGCQVRRPLVEALADLDPQVIFDGTWQPSTTREDCWAETLAAIGQMAPSAQAISQTPSDQGSTIPVVIRSQPSRQGSVLSMINPTRFALGISVRLAGATAAPDVIFPPAATISFRSHPQGAILAGTVEPYQVVVLAFPETNVNVLSAEVTWPPGTGEQLAREIQQLSTALAMLRSPPLWPILQNPGFEQPPQVGSPPVGWLLLGPPEATAELDPAVKRSGNFSLRLRSPRAGATVVSHPFQPPVTGRLAVRVYCRAGSAVPRLRLALEGRTTAGAVTVLGETISLAGPAAGMNSASGEFHFVDLEIADLPTADLQAVRLRVDLLDPGELWLDDVLLSQVAFSRVELVELMKLVAPAEAQVAQGKFAEPLRLLDSPWSGFLKKYVILPAGISLPQPVPTVAEVPPSTPSTPETQQSPSPFMRMWEWLPKRLRFF
ncbi:MAG: family 10 glycosylhydrolase [Thermoguttaceae bacterium]|nr:family 10 glycosylhydrolase [Thermoguttaceae bacterium]